jgi:hypothetical protein
MMEPIVIDRAAFNQGVNALFDPVIGITETAPPLLQEDRALSASYSIDCRNLMLNEEVSGTLQSKNSGGYSLNYINPVLYEQ